MMTPAQGFIHGAQVGGLRQQVAMLEQAVVELYEELEHAEQARQEAEKNVGAAYRPTEVLVAFLKDGVLDPQTVTLEELTRLAQMEQSRAIEVLKVVRVVTGLKLKPAKRFYDALRELAFPSLHMHSEECKYLGNGIWTCGHDDQH